MKGVVARAVDGVPLICPVVVEKFKPVGRVPPDSAKLSVPVPPVAVTGVNGVAALPTVRIVFGTACVVVSAGFTVRVADVPATPAVAPAALGTPVGMVLEPDVLGVTSTLKMQFPLAASEPPVRKSVVAPVVGENVPPQLVLAFGLAATARPPGRATVSATPDSEPVLGLVRVKVSVLLLPTAVVVGAAATVAVGAVGSGNWRVRVHWVSIIKSPFESQKNWLNTAEVDPSVETTVMFIVSKSFPPATFGWVKVTRA